jgi:cobalt-zinc-cadmium efflux system membrane fusion protein
MRVARRCAALAVLCVGHCIGTGAAVTSGSETITVHAQPVTDRFLAYAQVQPVALLAVRAPVAGIVATMTVAPGSRVTAGQALATLTGPEIQSLLVKRKSAVRSTHAVLTAAKQSLAIEHKQLSARLSTRQAVAAAQSAAATATAAFETARAQLWATQQMSALHAPSAGIVLSVSAANGERITAGQVVLTVQTSSSLWLKAAYYGADAASIRIGMKGRFQPAAGGAPVAVTVASVSAALGPDGGESVGLMAAEPAVRGEKTPSPWRNGERGIVTVEGATRSMVAVPTRALILYGGHWWVLERTPQGDLRRAVVPGPVRGRQTFIEKGIESGQQVVVQNAYLEFHREISRHYTPPD